MKWLDWRFLMAGGPYHHLVLVGGPAGLADEIVRAGVAREVSTTCDKPADAVVILDGADRAARQALACLAPGGCVYWETTRPARARRALRRTGVRLTGQFWVRPAFQRARAYLPLDRPAAIRWYLANLVSAPAALRLAASLASPWFRFAARGQALTGVLGDASSSLLSNPDQHPVVLTLGDASRRVVLLPFARDARRPTSVVKLSRTPSSNVAIEHEQEVLATLRARLDEPMRASIPEPRGTFRWCDLTVGIESCADGRLLPIWAPLARKLDDLRVVAAWLGRLHAEFPIERTVWGERLIGEWLERPLADYARHFGVTPAEQALFEAARARAHELVGRPVSLVWTHWGLREQNVYRGENSHGLVVVDWEEGEPGPPGFDLVYFVTHWSHAARKLRGLPSELLGVRDLYCLPRPPDRACAAARQVLDEYLARLDLDPRFLPMLLVSVWVFRALGQTFRGHPPGADPRAGNRYVDYLGVLADHTAMLFAPDWPRSADRAPSQ